ncbi:hypothetical protein I6A84_21560 [Frankia sp. CNm7]|uniref:Uncharacterized protein n=1 Tax=Frankia nepalensis TaxID=1836974 RepID=A0A937RCV1_9ACTN|nr:hypothetical protein [Frankia nepalensis]MBL7496549.1 hypothetical protein [Frankia nepalensis]MBL7508768.1 hypothetical protein [Frankia nepalensis]MBL7520605.1 hypothetical protein [Frankia nepalensis]MBL7627522.1 hypothetical protein [Frankia nepalensis]
MSGGDLAEMLGQRDALIHARRALPPPAGCAGVAICRRPAEADVAAALGCSVGTGPGLAMDPADARPTGPLIFEVRISPLRGPDLAARGPHDRRPAYFHPCCPDLVTVVLVKPLKAAVGS